MWKWLRRVFPSEHEWAAQQLSAYLDSELSCSDGARVEAHLRECQTCVEELRTLRWTVSLAAQMPALRAPRSFLITQAMARPRRRLFGVAYVYLRGATVAAAALLSLVVATDFLLPYALSPRIPGQPMGARPAVPAREELPVVVEAVREVQVEEEVERRPPATAPVALELAEATKPPAEAVAVEQEAEGEIQLEAAQLVKKEVAQKAMPPAPAPAEPAAHEELSAEIGAERAEQPREAEDTAPALPAAAPTPVATVPTPSPPASTPCVVYPTAQVQEVVASPQPTLSRAVAVAEPSEPTIRPPSPWRSALRLMEIGLALLMVPLVASTLILRARPR